MQALKAHGIAIVLLVALFSLVYGGVALKNGDFPIFLGMWLFLILPGGLLFIGIASLISLPVGVLLNKMLTYGKYTSLPEYIWAGAHAGILVAILTQPLLVNTAPEANGYEEVWGTARAMLYVKHYLMGAIAGAAHAISYWYVSFSKSSTIAKTPQEGQ